MFSRQAHGTIYFICLLLAAFLMLVSVWLLPVVFILMALNWLSEGNYRVRLCRLEAQPGITTLLLLLSVTGIVLFLTFAVTFCIPGMKLAMALILIPWLTNRKRTSYIFLLFVSLVLFSMFNYDTFSSFTGAVFFSYFYTLLIVTCRNNETQRRGEEIS